MEDNLNFFVNMGQYWLCNQQYKLCNQQYVKVYLAWTQLTDTARAWLQLALALSEPGKAHPQLALTISPLSNNYDLQFRNQQIIKFYEHFEKQIYDKLLLKIYEQTLTLIYEKPLPQINEQLLPQIYEQPLTQIYEQPCSWGPALFLKYSAMSSH